MGEFQRSPSKVWWGDESSSSWYSRVSSSSPGSQDSGFSDTETSPTTVPHVPKQTGGTPKERAPSQCIPKDILKEVSEEAISSPNLAMNCKEKLSPKKTLSAHLIAARSITSTPVRQIKTESRSEPPRRHKYWRNNSLKVNRSLFSTSRMESIKHNQYAAHSDDSFESQQFDVNDEAKYDGSRSWQSNENSFETPDTVQSCPTITNREEYTARFNTSSAPASLSAHPVQDGTITSTSLNRAPSFSDSDCESELECLFPDNLESPKHTSTPKAEFVKSGKNKLAWFNKDKHLLMKYNREKFTYKVDDIKEENAPSVQKWLNEARELYEPECMTALQCKSVAGELGQKVSYLAAVSTVPLRQIINDSRLIQEEFDNITSQNEHVGPVAQSLSGLITEFLRTYEPDSTEELEAKCNILRSIKTENMVKLLTELFNEWNNCRLQLIKQEVKKLVRELEDPRSELHLRSILTGITSIALRNEELVGLFASTKLIEILCVLCEKCEGSTVRALTLRTLSTVCYDGASIRQFEKCSGIQIIAETLAEDSRPEPERSEAAALLAQVTAPWIEDNHNVKGLAAHMKTLVKALTKFITTTKCCQNLLLCAAALANLSAMDSKSIRHILHQRTVRTLLEAVKKRGPRASVYLYEQVATLIANMSSKEEARKQLTEEEAPSCLLFYLHPMSAEEEIEKRLQQKSIIGLSRICGEKEAAKKIVSLGGVNRLVTLCREKKERYDSDAVLIASLTTLRKIAETCGNEVINVQDLQELVEPRLLDSFLAYSAQNESYV